MTDITMMPDPSGRWLMIFPCGATELRATSGPSWAAFELRMIEGTLYRIACHACGHVIEHLMHYEAVGTA